jgi:hypothetical protein
MSSSTLDLTKAATVGVKDPLFNFRVGDRAGGSLQDQAANLGLLAELPGNWRGHGFNLTARPFFKAPAGTPPFFLEINATQETLDFNAITGAVPNRGSLQDDSFLFGVRYLQQVSDVIVDAGIHIEPGLWLRVPPSTDPAQPGNVYVRQSTIPHGDSLIAQSSFAGQVVTPDIQPVNSLPFTDAVIPPLNGNPVSVISNDKGYLNQYLNGLLPPVPFLSGLNAANVIKDPTILLRDTIKNQTIISTTVLAISTTAQGSGLINIPFVTKNANATQLDAIFWVESVQRPDGSVFIQLQYVQRVILDFIGIHWPHISVATLKRI